MFDYELFALDMQRQSEEIIPADLSEQECNYISTTIYNFVKLAGESLNNDVKNNYSDEQKVFISQIIAEWTFHKSIDLIRAEIPCKYWDAIMQKIAFTIFEVTQQAVLREISREQLLQAVEYHVIKVYKECISRLPVNDKLKVIANEQSNIDEMAKKYSKDNKNHEGYSDTTSYKKEAKISSKIYVLFGLIGLIIIFVFGIILGHYHISLPQYDITVFKYIIVIYIVIFLMVYFTSNAEVKHQLKELVKVKKEMQELVNPDRMYNRLGVDTICLQLGQGLLCIADSDKDGKLLAELVALRQQMTDSLGYVIPHVRILDSVELEENEYSISIRNNIVDKGYVYPGRYMIIADQWDKSKNAPPNDVIKSKDPIYKTDVYWVNCDITKKAVKDIKIVSPDDVIITHLKETLIKQVDFVLSETEIRKYINTVKENDSVSTEDLLSRLSYGDIRQVFVNLIREKVSIRDITLLLSRLENYSRFHKEPDILSERIRKDFSRQISLAHCNDNKQIYAIDLSQKLTTELLKYVELQKEFSKTRLSLDKQYEHDFVENVGTKLMEAHKKINIQPVILCDEKLRLALYRLLIQYIPTIVVITNNEIEHDIELKTVNTLQ